VFAHTLADFGLAFRCSGLVAFSDWDSCLLDPICHLLVCSSGCSPVSYFWILPCLLSIDFFRSCPPFERVLQCAVVSAGLLMVHAWDFCCALFGFFQLYLDLRDFPAGDWFLAFPFLLC
jgi:hypothetical protein